MFYTELHKFKMFFFSANKIVDKFFCVFQLTNFWLAFECYIILVTFNRVDNSYTWFILKVHYMINISKPLLSPLTEPCYKVLVLKGRQPSFVVLFFMFSVTFKYLDVIEFFTNLRQYHSTFCLQTSSLC